MKMMKKYIINICFIICILLLCITIFFMVFDIKYNNITFQIKTLLFGNPIDYDTGLINNEFFNLNSSNSLTVAKGFNDAIEYANKNNISYIKLNENEYTIGDTIYLKSNICLDLNGSIIRYETNNKDVYSLIRINNESNIKIINGILIGDKDTHDYETINSTHEWGMGIRIHAGRNIYISNLSISNMTGDGIYISEAGYQNGILDNSSDIEINNCKISENRRQGISIISGENIEIYNNEIYSIKGTNPQVGIDLEANHNYEKIDNIKIYNNIFYDFNSKVAILLYSQAYNVDIVGNVINGSMSIYEIKGILSIENNNLKNGKIYTNLNSQNTSKILNEIHIKNNYLYNYDIVESNQVKKFEISNNINSSS